MVRLPEQRQVELAGGHRRLAVELGLTVPILTAAAIASQWPLFPQDPVFATVNVSVAVSFGLIRFLLRDDPAQRVTARLFGVAGVLWLVTWWTEWRVGPLPLLGMVAGPASLALVAWAVLRYPESRLPGPRETWFVGTLLCWLCGSQLVVVLVSHPEWNHISPLAWWPTVVAHDDAFRLVQHGYRIGMVLFAAVFLALVLPRLAGVRGLARAEQVPVAVAAATAAVVAPVEMIIGFFPLPEALRYTLWTLEGLALLATPVAFAGAALQRRLSRLAIADLVLSMNGDVTAESVRQALRRALRDPDLDIFYRISGSDAPVSAGGWQVPDLPDGEDRLAVPVETSDGEPLAVVRAAPYLRRHRALVDAAVTACGMALENARLQAEIRAQLRETRAAQTRILEAGLAERRRLERDLHDGAQQRLLGVAMTLGTARVGTQEPAAATAIDRARAELRQALEELRDLARGLHPAALTQGGLRLALEGVAERLPLPVEIEVPDVRLDPQVEAAAYFVASEALTNAARHARAGRATVRARIVADGLRLDVVDDGRGGADGAWANGLVGLADRVRALGGELTVASPPGAGTRLSARIPCG